MTIVDYIDMQPYLANGQRPNVMIKKRLDQEAFVPASPVSLQPGVPTDWAVTRDGDFVRVPVLPYWLSADLAHHALAGAFTLLEAALSQYYRPGANLHVTLGVNPQLTEDGKFAHVWAGFAIIRSK